MGHRRVLPTLQHPLQGRGSAANSPRVTRGITNADAVDLGLLFERFMSPERDGPEDSDIESRAIVVKKPFNTSTTSTAISCGKGRKRNHLSSALVGARHGQGMATPRASKTRSRVDSIGGPASVTNVARARDGPSERGGETAGAAGTGASTGAGFATAGSDTVPSAVVELATEIEHFLAISAFTRAACVICDRPVIEVCPGEWAAWKIARVAVGQRRLRRGRSREVDLLGLGMLSALHYAIDFIRDHHGVDVDLATIPQEDVIYDMLCDADSIGVFQVESRAQMATLPRLRPRTFYDLVVEVALIRPGPIQGGSVHPYIRRRNGKEPVTYLHPLLENSLAKTLGIPLFQEQLMQMATMCRRTASKRSTPARRWDPSAARAYGAIANNVSPSARRAWCPRHHRSIWDKLAAFANYGFPESHSVSFAYLVYASSWIKYHYPGAFCAALLNAQPMGFYSPHSLVQDARRHGVEVRTPCVNESAAKATLQSCPSSHKGAAVRLGIEYVRSVGADLAERIAAGRPYVSMEDFARRTGVSLTILESFATAGAFDCFNEQVSAGARRRHAIWSAGAVAQSKPDRLEGIVTGSESPPLPDMSSRELALADLWASQVSPDGTHAFRTRTTRREGWSRRSAAQPARQGKSARRWLVTHRQRTGDCGWDDVLNLEDETGLINVVVSGVLAAHREVLGVRSRGSPRVGASQ